MASRNVACIVFVVIVVATASLGLRPRTDIANSFFIDDAYYALSIARNIAAGNGITYDGTQLTNGFQPLYTFALVPLFWIAGLDRYLALVYVYALGWLVYIATGLILGMIVRDFARPGPANGKGFVAFVAALYTGLVDVFRLHANGLETGLLLLVYTALWRYFQMRKIETVKAASILGIALGVLVLVRIDAGFFAVVCACLAAAGESGVSTAMRVRLLAIVGGCAAVVTLPWWVFNMANFGSPIPISGLSQQHFLFSSLEWTSPYERVRDTVKGIAAVLAPIPYHVSPRPVLGFLMFLLFVTLFLEKHGRLLLKSILPWKACSSVEARTLRFAQWVLVSQGLLGIWYLLTSTAVYFFPRYLSPVLLVTVFMAGLVLWTSVSSSKARTGLALLIVGAPLLQLCLGAWNSAVQQGPPFYSDQLALVQDSVPDRDLVAADQSGTLGYFRDRVVNLDGKVNPEAYRLRGRTRELVERLHINWICDWPLNVRLALGVPPEQIGFIEYARRGDFVLYKRK